MTINLTGIFICTQQSDITYQFW